MKTTRCVICRSEFTDQEIDGHVACPMCSDKGTPMAIKDDVKIAINWHELRILTIWASNYAHMAKLEEGSQNALCSIIKQLEAQHPDKTPLTLLGEVAQLDKYLRANKMGDGVQLFEGGEQTYPEPLKVYTEDTQTDD